MPRIVVVGSINMDLVTAAARFPGPGETLLGEKFFTTPGGKGANQAVAAARLGADVILVGAIGRDAFGDQLRDNLQREGIAMDHLQRLDDEASGTASITVAQGENQIVVVPAANARVTPAHVETARRAIEKADAVLVQLEIPLATVEAAVRLCHQLNVPVILNPAPSQPLPHDWLKLVSYLTPNQHELAEVLGAGSDENFHTLMRLAPCPVVLTHGAEGAWYRENESEPTHQRGFTVYALDSTGAGDTFNAALAVYLHEGLPEAVRKACAAAALSVTKMGAQGGMPDAAAVEALLTNQSS